MQKLRPPPPCSTLLQDYKMYNTPVDFYIKNDLIWLKTLVSQVWISMPGIKT